MDAFLINKNLNEEEIKQRKIILNSKPRFLMIALTNKCNLDCIMCRRICHNDKNFIKFDIIKKIYSILPYLEGINWQGGEVFLVDYFKELFTEIKKYKNIRQSIITNGLLIDEEWIELFLDAYVCLTFSIDAVSKDTYERIRRGARFEQLLRILDMFSYIDNNKNIDLSINAVVMRTNYKELILFPDFCKKYGFRRLRFDYLIPGRSDLSEEEDIFLNQRDENIMKYLKNTIIKIEQKCKELNINFECTFTPFLFKNNFTNLEAKSNSYINSNFNLKCKIPWRTLFIDIAPFCDIRPHCVCLHSIGNLKEESIDDAWNNKTMQIYRKKIIDNDIHDWCSEKCIYDAVDPNHFEGSC